MTREGGLWLQRCGGGGAEGEDEHGVDPAAGCSGAGCVGCALWWVGAACFAQAAGTK